MHRNVAKNVLRMSGSCLAGGLLVFVQMVSLNEVVGQREKRFELFVGILSVGLVTFSGVLAVVGGSILSSYHRPNQLQWSRRQGAWIVFQLIWKEMSIMLAVIIVSIVLVYGYSPELCFNGYVGILIGVNGYCMITAEFNYAIRMYIRQNTVEGQAKRKTRELKGWRRWRRKMRLNWWSFLGTNASLLYLILASRVFFDQTAEIKTLELCIFGGGSILMKVILQQLAIKRILRSGAISISFTMVVQLTIALFIDTQIRMVLSQLNTVKHVVEGTVLLMLLEFVSRAMSVKKMKIKMEWYRKSVSKEEFQRYQRNALQCQAAKLYADMISEYNSIGISLLVYIGLEPHDIFKIQTKQTNLETLFLHFVQVAVEIIVDTISVWYEISQKVHLDKILKHDSSLKLTLCWVCFALGLCCFGLICVTLITTVENN